MATIRLENVTRRFEPRVLTTKGRAGEEEHGGVAALDHVNLTVPNGQTLAVLGPSGCGKSTLLRVVAGLDMEYSGHVFYDGQPMEQVPPKDRFIGMVFQNYALYPHFAGYGNLSFFFRLRKFSDEEAEERIRITSELMGIGFEQLLPRRPGTLSGGQQQRVAIARAIVRNPRLFLFDEPLSNLDAKLRVQTRIEIKRLLHRFKITALYVTHDQTEAITLGDQIAVMRDGRIEQVGRFQDLRDLPVNLFVAGFLGHPPMNLMAGGVVQESSIQFAAANVDLPGTARAQIYPGQQIVVGMRPEVAHVLVGGQATVPGLRLRGEVEVVEPDFARQTQLLYLRAGEQTFAAAAGLNPPYYVGDTVEVVFPTDDLHFFDAVSELRL